MIETWLSGFGLLFVLMGLYVLGWAIVDSFRKDLKLSLQVAGFLLAFVVIPYLLGLIIK